MLVNVSSDKPLTTWSNQCVEFNFFSLLPMDPFKFFDKISNSPHNANSDSLVNMDNTQEVKDAKEFDMTSRSDDASSVTQIL